MRIAWDAHGGCGGASWRWKRQNVDSTGNVESCLPPALSVSGAKHSTPPLPPSLSPLLPHTLPQQRWYHALENPKQPLLASKPYPFQPLFQPQPKPAQRFTCPIPLPFSLTTMMMMMVMMVMMTMMMRLAEPQHPIGWEGACRLPLIRCLRVWRRGSSGWTGWPKRVPIPLKSTPPGPEPVPKPGDPALPPLSPPPNPLPSHPLPSPGHLPSRLHLLWFLRVGNERKRDRRAYCTRDRDHPHHASLFPLPPPNQPSPRLSTYRPTHHPPLSRHRPSRSLCLMVLVLMTTI